MHGPHIQLVALALVVTVLAGCDKVPDKLCHTGTKHKCCVVTTGSDTYASTCVADEVECRDFAAGSPYTTNVDKDTDVNKIRSCVTKWKRDKLFGIFGIHRSGKSGDADEGDMGPLVARESLEPASIPVTFSDDPIDCKRTCEQGIGEFCKSFDSTSALGGDLKEFRVAIQGGVAKGSLTMEEIHRIFGVAEESDPCQRSELALSNGQLVNTGIGKCELDASIQVGQRPLPITVEIPPEVRGSFGVLEGDALDSIIFSNPDNTLALRIGDSELNQRWGGSVRRLQMTEKDLLVSTDRSCVRLGLGTNAMAQLIGASP